MPKGINNSHYERLAKVAQEQNTDFSELDWGVTRNSVMVTDIKRNFQLSIRSGTPWEAYNRIDEDDYTGDVTLFAGENSYIISMKDFENVSEAS